MIAEYSRCESGKRCVVKTDDSFFFLKFTLLVAIKNSKCIGWTLYEKGGMNKERFVEFLKIFIFNLTNGSNLKTCCFRKFSCNWV